MSFLDLNKPFDFARLTLSGPAGFLQSLPQGDPTQWQLQEASYKTAKFHVFKTNSEFQAALTQVDDNGGRRKVFYKFPYTDGQTSDDLGRAPLEFSAQVVFHGPNYLVGWLALKAKIDDGLPGPFIHPVFGSLECVCRGYKISHTSQSRQAMMVTLDFSEHSFTAGFETKVDKSVKSAISAALSFFGKIDSAISNVQGAVLLAQSVKNQLGTLLTSYKAAFGSNLSKMNLTFNQGSSVDIPGALPTNLGGNINSDGTLASNTFSTLSGINDPFASVTTLTATSTFTTVEAVDAANSMRANVNTMLELIDENGGSLELFDTSNDLRDSALAIQDVVEKGVASSKQQIINYITPRNMSVREVAFACGVDLDNVDQIDALNPFLFSLNEIQKGTALQVPVSV